MTTPLPVRTAPPEPPSVWETSSPSTPVIPHCREAEEAAVGAVLINPEAYHDLAQFLQADDFYIVRHRWIWEAFTSLHEQHIPLDFLTLTEELDTAGRLNEIGGPAYLTALLNQVPTSLHAEAYGRQIKQAAIRRGMLTAANALATVAYQDNIPTDKGLTETRTEIDRLLCQSTGHEVKRLSPILSTVYDKIKERSTAPCDMWGIPIGLPKLDNETGGQQPGELTLLAGEPGLGKTWFAIGAALEMSKSAPGAFFSLEMGAEATTRRILSAQSGVRSRNMRTGKILESDWIKISQTIGELETLPFYLDDRVRDTGGLRASLARLKRESNIQWFVLDYLMLLEDAGSNETEKTSNISRALKIICRDLDLAGFVIHSVTKAGMDKAGAEANAKSNLRGSGQVIYDADLVLYLTEFDPESKFAFMTPEQKKRLATLWVKKGRELEDSHIRVHLTRRENSPLWGEMKNQ